MKKIIISGGIGYEVTESAIRSALPTNGDDVEVLVASPGGFVFQGLEIFNIFRDYKRENPNAQMMLTIKGLCASMATYLAACEAFDLVAAEDNAVFMIHNPINGIIGDYRDMKKNTDFLQGLTDLLSNAYVKKTGMKKKDITEMMDYETWFFGEEIKNAGFVDEIIKTDEIKDKSSAVAVAKMSYKELVAKMKASENIEIDYERAAAIIKTQEPKAPYENEHAARIIEPSKFEQDSFRRKNIKKGIDIIIGKLKNEDSMTTQAYRFSVDEFTAEEAKKWLKDNNIKYISFEAAKNKSKEKSETPVVTGNNNQEETSMTLKEFLDSNPAAKKEYDDAMTSSYNDGEKKGKADAIAVASKASAFVGNKDYPSQVSTFAVLVMKGEKSLDALDALVANADMIKEMQNSNATSGEQRPDGSGDHSQPISADGIVKTDADIKNAVAEMRSELGLGGAQ